MFKRLIHTSVSAVLGWSAFAKGAQRHWTSSSVPPGPSSTPPSGGIGSEPGAVTLHSARQDFIDALADIHSPPASGLVKRLHNARSMRELWFLRTEFFYLIAQHHDQATAKARLERVDSHFPRREHRRSSRSLGGIES